MDVNSVLLFLEDDSPVGGRVSDGSWSLRFGSGANLVKGGIFVVVLGNCRRWLMLGVGSSA